MVITTLLSQLLIAVPSLILGTTTLTSAINGIFKINKGWLRHLISWLVAVAIAVVLVATGGLSFGLPVLWGEYVAGIVAGLLAGGAANGFYDWDAIKNIFDKFEQLFRKKEKPVEESAAEETPVE